MALATQCPHCHTTFRVANDQLKLHAGIVRCGSCQQIFNGIEHLVAPDAAPPATAPATAATEPAVAPVAADPVPATAIAEQGEPAAIPAADVLDFDLGIFDATPLTAAKKPADAVAARREPFLEPAPEPIVDGAEDAELQQRMALLAAAEADWSFSDEGPAAEAAEPPEDVPLIPDAEDFQPAAHAGLASESAPAADAEPGFEPEFAPDFLSEFESVFEEEIHADAVQDNDQPVSLAEPEQQLHGEPGEADSNADELWPAAPPADAGPALKAASVDPEPLEQQHVSSLSESEAPDFVVQAERRQARSKAVRVTMTVLSILLCFSLLAQATYTMRNQLAAWFPQAKPALADACKLLNCQISLLTQIDAVSIESNELQAMAPNKNIFSLTLLLRNKGGTPQAWPMLELTLDNDKEQAVLRKVFTPAEYLANKADLAKGFPGTSEQPVKLYFELETVKAAGYHVWLFYP
ncbi:DUF3426 domain-containing protein [Undibacterium sp.]|jgi:predicted Zn finger-like uncharacterized protein|uniref:DUF3426 domain-containing protein n=1 Tax=Undibacterium sp. TaxID=1914977 RepID=UPI002C8BAAC9|nr:DUF3426 domain-containing protein [Undibacterium sp.]HTD02836.1 DUF3426 domain-containing protein [Undibacterium sp.]